MSTHNMFSSGNKKNTDTFCLKKVPYQELCCFSNKTYVVSTHKKHLGEEFLVSNHKIYFHGEIRKISEQPTYLNLCLYLMWYRQHSSR